MEAITPWEVYWILQMDTISKTALVLALVALGVAFVIFIISSTAYFNDDITFRSWIILNGCTIPIAMFLVVLAVLVPNTKTLASVYVLPPIINNDRVQEIPDKVLDVLDLSIERYEEVLDTKEDEDKHGVCIKEKHHGS